MNIRQGFERLCFALSCIFCVLLLIILHSDIRDGDFFLVISYFAGCIGIPAFFFAIAMLVAEIVEWIFKGFIQFVDKDNSPV